MRFTEILQQNKAWHQLPDQLQPKQRFFVGGMTTSAKAAALASLFEQRTSSQLIVVNDVNSAVALAEQLQTFIAADQVQLFLTEDDLAPQLALSSPQFKTARLQTLAALAKRKKVVVVANLAAAVRPTLDPQTWQSLPLKVEVGGTYDFTDLTNHLTKLGYQATQMVAKPGEFAVRGSIIDIYAVGTPAAVRLDFFDDELDALKQLDVSTQTSTENLTTAVIEPATDLLVDEAAKKRAIAKFSDQIAASKLATHEQAKLTRQLTQLKTKWAETGVTAADWLFAREFFKTTTVLDYLDDADVVVVDDYARLKKTEHDQIAATNTYLQSLQQELRLPAGMPAPRVPLAQLLKVSQPQLFLALLTRGVGRLKFSEELTFSARPVEQFFGQMELFKSSLAAWSQQQSTVVILINDAVRLKKFQSDLLDWGVSAPQTKLTDLKEHQVQVVHGSLPAGFELPEAKLVVLTEQELFAKPTAVKRQVFKNQTFENAQRLRNYTDLKPGDYVVHINHGIGKFLGLKTIPVGNVKHDYLALQYHGDDKLYVPVNQLDRVQKYVSAEGRTPKIDKLGSSKWYKTKQKVQSKIEDIADDLIDLYAERKAQKGFAYPPDDAKQREFEAAFPYVETKDQLKSAAEIKTDMESDQPMDRLLIGDVGFGKTEVALRAAFKAIESGKQVAFLAPTTVLAQQHYATMQQRFSGYDINIGLLSRFVSAKQAKATLADLAQGKCDIIVGTHRLLSADVKFFDLGLLIIDEEQRFGVKHKERLKQLKANVDVLTLTATPIPRTLNMSMLGVRDLSVIETPPSNRFPIQTYVLEQNFAVISQALQKEVSRGGQVFYLHNRVDDIERVVGELQSLNPNLRIAAIHGKMSETQLERILMDFVDGNYDVLVTTTIIETGVDIPNANTLLVENADKMGLAQLYQLRGRVGRSNRVAYAYFMYQPNKVLSEVGEKRLEAIKDFTELGSGFRIAMRDLAIRGAGNLLGKQQHGFIDSVGYDLYTQMLTDAVKQKQGKKVTRRTNAELKWQLEAFLPDEYIADARQKIEIYHRIAQLKSEEQLLDVQADLIDRFGDYPAAVANLLEAGRIKMYADAGLITLINQTPKNVAITFDRQASEKLLHDKVSLAKLLKQVALQTQISVASDQLTVKLVTFASTSAEAILQAVLQFVQAAAKYFAQHEVK